ncbi:hypothetical protein H9I45_11180 [Polaribacter haliotis]|uniref:Uncharacterized protein n=1 Tax=Polaribacter haliotis TaxID=1888915 RepID=A0A7L8ADH4_9FLAO|nr:DUF6168 family protein [Polaribacter haliotis]QOD59909.1 hypothetical protein H9I45_11180 [Polaribacter haliotis]
MNKDIFRYILVFVALFLIGYYTHLKIIESQGLELQFSLEKVYLFHAFFSALICINLRFVSTVDKLFPQLGFIYLGTLVVKLILFAIFFYNPLFTVDSFSFSEKIALFIPLFIFLLTEAIFVLKILNQKE